MITIQPFLQLLKRCAENHTFDSGDPHFISQIPGFRHELSYKRGKENTALGDLVPERDDMDHFEHSMRAYLSAGERVFQYPLMSYECETIEDTALLSQERMHCFRQERSLAPAPVRLRLLAARKFKS